MPLVPHLVPEARVFNFALFRDYADLAVDGSITSKQLPVVKSDFNRHTKDGDLEDTPQANLGGLEEVQSQDIDGASKQAREERQSCSAQGLEKQAYALLDATKEQNPTSQQVCQD